jgi:hypothetical protein
MGGGAFCRHAGGFLTLGGPPAAGDQLLEPVQLHDDQPEVVVVQTVGLVLEERGRAQRLAGRRRRYGAAGQNVVVAGRALDQDLGLVVFAAGFGAQGQAVRGRDLGDVEADAAMRGGAVQGTQVLVVTQRQLRRIAVSPYRGEQISCR